MTGFFGPALLVFTAAAFVLPGEASYGLVFYIVMLPLVAWHCRHRKLPGRALGLAFLLIAWSGLTLLWTEDPGHRRAGFAFATLCTAAFVTALDATFADPAWRRRWAGLLVWAGAGNAAWSLLHGLPSLHAGERILGWGVTRQPILGGAVMSLAYLTAASRAGTSGCSPRSRILYLAAATAMAAFVLAMQSRGALLAAAGGTILLLAAGPWRLRAAMAFAAAFAAWFIVIPESWHRHLSQLLLERGTSHRFEIWSVTWRLIRQKPILGHGLAANVPPSPTGFPHSLILSLLFYSGSVGLLLFLALAGLAAIRLAKTPKTPDRVWVAASPISDRSPRGLARSGSLSGRPCSSPLRHPQQPRPLARQPRLRRRSMRRQPCRQRPEIRSMIEMAQMRHLVRHHVILHQGRRHQQPPAEHQRPLRRTASPACARIPHPHPAKRHPCRCRLFLRQDEKSPPCFRPQEVTDTPCQKCPLTRHHKAAGLEPRATTPFRHVPYQMRHTLDLHLAAILKTRHCGQRGQAALHPAGVALQQCQAGRTCRP
jgi:O-antigen ligase